MDLATIWFLLWGLLWAVYFITDGSDLGIGVLLPFLGRDETRRRIMHRVVGPLWDGNEVWLLTAGGVTFAAFPKMYAVMFSTFYTPLMLLLFALIFRGVSFEFRTQVASNRWRRLWDASIFLGSLLPAILLGAAFGNLFRGLPIDGQGVLHGSLLTFLNPYGLLVGVLFLLFFLVHGATMLAAKSEGDLRRDAAAAAGRLWYGLLVAAVVTLAASAWSTGLYANYLAQPVLFAIVGLAVAALVLVKVFLASEKYWRAWFASAVFMLGVTYFGIVGLYPIMLPSTLDPAFSIDLQGAASSPLTLKIMLGLALVFVPVVLAYQIKVNLLFKGQVTETDLEAEEGY